MNLMVVLHYQMTDLEQNIVFELYRNIQLFMVINDIHMEHIIFIFKLKKEEIYVSFLELLLH
jgi:hypothetical protein